MIALLKGFAVLQLIELLSVVASLSRIWEEARIVWLGDDVEDSSIEETSVEEVLSTIVNAILSHHILVQRLHQITVHAQVKSQHVLGGWISEEPVPLVVDLAEPLPDI